LVSSVDDWYVTKDGLVITETTNSICNATLWTLIKPQALLSWQRTVIANMLAVDGQSWTELFCPWNSGTYNNQFQIVDTRLLTDDVTSSSLPANLLWVVEQMPGGCVAGDATSFLQSTGYWSSYNRPYYPNVFQAMGFTKAQQVYGDYFSWDKCPRANIFRRDQGGVVTEADMRRIMRYNNWKYDPLSLGNPDNAIAARGDLVPVSDAYWPGRSPSGAIDCKMVSLVDLREGECLTSAISGPTSDQQPVFAWSTSPYANTTHQGQPDVFNFPWLHFKLV